jgi:mycoredoxin
MKLYGVLIFYCLVANATESRAQQPVVMYGAPWCGPCMLVKNFLTKNRVPFTFKDVSDRKTMAEFHRASPMSRGIPLVLIGTDKVQGSNIDLLITTLQQNGHKVAGLTPIEDRDLYGGQTAQWWQKQFFDLRRQLKECQTLLDNIDPKAVYAVDKDELREDLQAKLKVLSDSLDLFEAEASRAGVPRQYRAYQ